MTEEQALIDIDLLTWACR